MSIRCFLIHGTYVAEHDIPFAAMRREVASILVDQIGDAHVKSMEAFTFDVKANHTIMRMGIPTAYKFSEVEIKVDGHADFHANFVVAYCRDAVAMLRQRVALEIGIRNGTVPPETYPPIDDRHNYGVRHAFQSTFYAAKQGFDNPAMRVIEDKEFDYISITQFMETP